MKAVVTGSNGFIGFNLCQALAAQNWTVAGIDDLSSGRREFSVPGVQYHFFAIEERKRTAEFLAQHKPDVVLHLAAVPRVGYSVAEPFLTAQANVMGTLSLLEGIVHAGLSKRTRFVFSSSSSVYGGEAPMPTREDAPLHPRSPYALQKAQGEQWLALYATLYGLDCVSLRYFNVFGPHALFGGAYSTVLSAWLYHLFVDPSYVPFIEGDGSQTRDFCYVDNVVEALWLAATRGRKFAGEAFNIAQGAAHSLRQVRAMLEEIAGRPLPLEERPDRVGDVKHTLADISLARDELAYQPDTDFAGQLRQMADWYRSSYPK